MTQSWVRGLVGKKKKKANGQGNPSCIKRVGAPLTILLLDGGRELTDDGSSKGSARVMSL